MKPELVIDQIKDNLSRLRLSQIGKVLPDVIKAAEEQGKSYLAFLDELLEEEVEQKEQRRIERNLKTSGLPFIKTIDEFDFGFQPNLNRQKVMSLFDMTFILRKDNVIFLGPTGVGKTHLAAALAVKACQTGMSIYCITMERLIKKLKEDDAMGDSGKRRGYSRSALVIIDEIGYTPINREECNLFFRFVVSRYERASMIIISNKGFSAWTEMFGDQVIITAILDRLLHHSVIINIQGESYRLKEKAGKEVKNTG